MGSLYAASAVCLCTWTPSLQSHAVTLRTHSRVGGRWGSSFDVNWAGGVCRVARAVATAAAQLRDGPGGGARVLCDCGWRPVADGRRTDRYESASLEFGVAGRGFAEGVVLFALVCVSGRLIGWCGVLMAVVALQALWDAPLAFCAVSSLSSGARAVLELVEQDVFPRRRASDSSSDDSERESS